PPTPVPPAPAAPPAVSAAPRPAPRAVLSGIHTQRASAELVSIELCDRLLGVVIGFELHECEAARPAALAIRGKKHVLNCADLREKILNLVAARFEVEVPNKDLRRHPFLLSARGHAKGRKNCAARSITETETGLRR